MKFAILLWILGCGSAEVESPPEDEALTELRAGDHDFAEEKYKEAIEHFDKVIDLEPENGVVYSKRGVCYYELDRPKRAIKDFKKAKSLDPDIPNIDTYITMAKKAFE